MSLTEQGEGFGRRQTKMAAQVVGLQHLLLKAEEKRQRDIEELALQHNNALCTLEAEKEELSAELERSEEGRGQEVKAVRVQWEVGRGRLNGEVATLTNQLKELEHSYGDLERKMVEEKSDWDRQQRALREQLAARDREGQTSRQEMAN